MKDTASIRTGWAMKALWVVLLVVPSIYVMWRWRIERKQDQSAKALSVEEL